jgi:hypothetical protein
MRFSIRAFFFVTAIIAVISYGVYWARNDYYSQLRAVSGVLAEHPEIDKVWLGTNPDVQLEVEQVYFSIVGQPDLTFYTYGMDGSTTREFRERLERALQERHPVPRPLHLPLIDEFPKN